MLNLAMYSAYIICQTQCTRTAASLKVSCFESRCGYINTSNYIEQLACMVKLSLIKD